MVEPLRHRQTKEAATDMFNLKQPRHISTLPNSDHLGCRPGAEPINAPWWCPIPPFRDGWLVVAVIGRIERQESRSMLLPMLRSHYLFLAPR
jgi:hypothetical protein